jgi:hypothetical protein
LCVNAARAIAFTVEGDVEFFMEFEALTGQAGISSEWRVTENGA